MPTRKEQPEPTELSPTELLPAENLKSAPRLQLVSPGYADEVCDVYAGLALPLLAQLHGEVPAEHCTFTWTLAHTPPPPVKSECYAGQFKADDVVYGPHYHGGSLVTWLTNGATPGTITVTVKAELRPEYRDSCHPLPVLTAKRDYRLRDPRTSDLKANFDQKVDHLVASLQQGVTVNLQRSAIQPTSDLALWVVIRESTRALSFENYQRYMDMLLCGLDANGRPFPGNNPLYEELKDRRFLPFNDTDAYRLLKTATEAFLLVSGGVGGTALNAFDFSNVDLTALNARFDGLQFDQAKLGVWWNDYLVNVNGAANLTIPYLELVRMKLKNEPLKNQIFLDEDPLVAALDPARNVPERCQSVLRSKLTRPFLLELIWSYWHEEGMVVQTMNAISRRFQNFRSPDGERDPLANLEMDPLRPLNNLMWGYIQDEQHRLSLVRRAYEYDHHYGISLLGKAVPKMRGADSRSKFIEAFHQLLHQCVGFFKQDDDTTVRADGFPVLNALKEVHLILSQGAHNQFGDLPSTARQEMLVQQFLLARPEFREFLPARVMVAYPEPWMDRVDAMKHLMNWQDTSVLHFHNLAVYGEQLLLSIRYGAWNQPDVIPAQAANWARFWRAEIQGYIHAYRTATGVDLTLPNRVDSTPPAVHLRNRLARRA